MGQSLTLRELIELRNDTFKLWKNRIISAEEYQKTVKLVDETIHRGEWNRDC